MAVQLVTTVQYRHACFMNAISPEEVAHSIRLTITLCYKCSIFVLNFFWFLVSFGFCFVFVFNHFLFSRFTFVAVSIIFCILVLVDVKKLLFFSFLETVVFVNKKLTVQHFVNLYRSKRLNYVVIYIHKNSAVAQGLYDTLYRLYKKSPSKKL